MDTNATAEKYQVITRDFTAAPEQVWKCWTEPELLKQWFAQENCDLPVCTIDLRVGGRQFQCVRSNVGTDQEWNTYCGWTYTEIVPQRRLAMLGFFADKEGNEVPPSYYGATVWPDEVEIYVELEPHNGGTRMTYTETRLPVPLQDEWAQQSFDRLEQLLNAVTSPTS